jgi:catechol 2,3-dioxygenase-like lactoylglutathione lyase family enzyme
VTNTRPPLALDHVGVRVVDIAAATRLYTAMLAPLGIVQHADGGFGPVGGVAALWLYEDARGGGVHLAFAAPDRQAVAAFHTAGIAAGATDHGAPRLRLDYSPTYYVAFLLDGSGNNLEAVCM